MSATFINHCGAEIITLPELRELDDPTPITETHFPIRHDLLIDTVKENLAPAGYEIVREEYSLRQDGEPGTKAAHDDLFGIFEFKSERSEVSNMAAIRNSGTMNFLAQLGCGERVFVCDNLCFSAQIIVGRKHTRFIERDLPLLAGKAISKLSEEFAYAEKRIEVYQDSELSRTEVHDVMMRSMSMKKDGCPASQLKPWLEEFDHPRHEEFENKSAWALKNAFTEVAKRWSFDQVQGRTGVLTGILDQAVDLSTRVEALLGGSLSDSDGEIVEADSEIALGA